MSRKSKPAPDPITIELVPIGRDRWDAYHRATRIVAGSYSPEIAACAVLAAQGLTGTAVTRHRGSTTPAMRIDIAQAAARYEAQSARFAELRRAA